MIIDSHAHIFPKEMCDNRDAYLDGEPAFKLLYESHKSKMIDGDELIAAMDEQGVDKSIVFGFPWKKRAYYEMNNDCVIDAVKKYPDRLIGMACFDTACPNAPAETLRCIDNGLIGVGELAFYQSGIDAEALKQLEPIMAICRKKAMPAVIHTNEPVGHMYPGKTPITLSQIYNLGVAFPDNKIVLAHLGGGIFFYNLLKRDAQNVLKNFWYDTAAVPFLYQTDIYNRAAELAGEDKIVFGTDYPLLKPSRYFNDMEKGGVSPERMQKINGENIARLFADFL